MQMGCKSVCLQRILVVLSASGLSSKVVRSAWCTCGDIVDEEQEHQGTDACKRLGRHCRQATAGPLPHGYRHRQRDACTPQHQS